MFSTVFRYELRYHLRRPVTWFYFAIFAPGSFALVTTDAIGLIGGSGQVMRNAPWVIVRAMMFVVTVGMIVVAGLVGSAMLRDYQYRTHELFFTTPITKFAYLGGRFFAAFTVMVIVHFGIVVGLLLGAVMPWLDPARLLPVHRATTSRRTSSWWCPAMLVLSAIFFAVGALTRSFFAIYTQGIVCCPWSIAQTLAGKITDQTIVAMLDPLGSTTFEIVTRYWTVAEKNTRSIPLGGLLLANRILWSAAALGARGAHLRALPFPERTALAQAQGADQAPPAPRGGTVLGRRPLVSVTPVFGARTWWMQLLSTVRTTFLGIVRQAPVRRSSWRSGSSIWGSRRRTPTWSSASEPGR